MEPETEIQTMREFLASHTDFFHSLDDTQLDKLYVCAKHRDSYLIEVSNFDCIEKEFEDLGDEVIRFGHWAVGWIEYLIVDDTSKNREKLSKIYKDLDNYPVYDEGHWVELQYEEAQDIWEKCYDERERLEFVREHQSSFQFDNMEQVLDCIRRGGFYGDASLIAN